MRLPALPHLAFVPRPSSSWRPRHARALKTPDSSRHGGLPDPWDRLVCPSMSESKRSAAVMTLRSWRGCIARAFDLLSHLPSVADISFNCQRCLAMWTARASTTTYLSCARSRPRPWTTWPAGAPGPWGEVVYHRRAALAADPEDLSCLFFFFLSRLCFLKAR